MRATFLWKVCTRLRGDDAKSERLTENATLNDSLPRSGSLNILLVTQFYTPEHNAGAFRATDHAREWADRGHKVTVLTGWPHYPKGELFAGYSMTSLAEEFIDGVRVVRSRVVARPLTSSIRRIQNGVGFFTFGVANVLLRKKQIGDSFDVVVASSGTVFTGWLGWACAKAFRAPLVTEYRDLAFEQMVATGSRPNGLGVRLMRFCEVTLAKKSKRVVVLTNGFRSILAREGVDSSVMAVVPNGADPRPRKGHPAKEGLVFGYFGTMGISQDVPGTLGLAAVASEASGQDLRYILIGDGAARDTVNALLSSGSYSFAELMDGMPQEELEPYYGLCHMTVVSLRKSPRFEATIPSKIFQSFARGVPVLFSGPEGEAARIIKEAGAGLVLAGTREEDEELLRHFFSSGTWRDDIESMGIRALNVLKQSYSRSTLAGRMLEVVVDATEEGATR